MAGPYTTAQYPARIRSTQVAQLTSTEHENRRESPLARRPPASDQARAAGCRACSSAQRRRPALSLSRWTRTAAGRSTWPTSIATPAGFAPPGRSTAGGQRGRAVHAGRSPIVRMRWFRTTAAAFSAFCQPTPTPWPPCPAPSQPPKLVLIQHKLRLTCFHLSLPGALSLDLNDQIGLEGGPATLPSGALSGAVGSAGWSSRSSRRVWLLRRLG